MTPAIPELVPVGDPTLLGTVVEFDDQRGIGTVRCGDRSVPFHCTAISDGSRHIDVGTVVAVRVRAARLGRLEAGSVRPVPAGDGAGGTPVPADDRPGAHSRRAHADYRPGDPPSVEASGVTVSGVEESGVEESGVPSDRVAPPGPVPGSPAPPAPVAEPVTPSPADPSATPVSGTPAVAPSAPESGTGTGIDGVDDGDTSAPRPNFWSPLPRSPAGPPPTWSTPVTPRVPPTDPS